MTQSDIMLGVQLYFAREGVDYGESGSEITSAVDAKPINPTTGWDKLACCEQWEPTNEKNETVVRCPENGVWSDRKVITTGRSLSHNFQLQQWDDLSLELLLLASKPDSSGDFVPAGATDNVRGWLYAEAYTQDKNDAPTLVIDTWVDLSIGSHQFKEAIEPHALIAKQLYSALNAGNIFQPA